MATFCHDDDNLDEHEEIAIQLEPVRFRADGEKYLLQTHALKPGAESVSNVSVTGSTLLLEEDLAELRNSYAPKKHTKDYFVKQDELLSTMEDGTQTLLATKDIESEGGKDPEIKVPPEEPDYTINPYRDSYISYCDSLVQATVVTEEFERPSVMAPAVKIDRAEMRRKNVKFWVRIGFFCLGLVTVITMVLILAPSVDEHDKEASTPWLPKNAFQCFKTDLRQLYTAGQIFTTKKESPEFQALDWIVRKDA